MQVANPIIVLHFCHAFGKLADPMPIIVSSRCSLVQLLRASRGPYFVSHFSHVLGKLADSKLITVRPFDLIM